ncbi:transglycosylase family protein [Streptomyces tropicalis]|uniref:Transglycosylase family protein n=1 Tax=Streptomyces tropicalis TaxID=3034234 RepID=A0ABT6AAD2_9ACTN|nr:transglycosylase family protein [Streptomyces tropicalis]MDF3301621.1 transglycosylase family protein [Streptomyces tropicalis]
MLPGNGRHRRPRQAPALLVAAGVTGSVIAIPLFAASGASAAEGTTWDKVAECESGGSWSADNGNGFYGGLQLSQDDWERYGGLSFAESPDQASRSQQIAVGERILADQGPGAWPTCGLLSGLTKSSGAAAVDTGVGDGSSDTPGNSGSSGSSGSAGGSDTGLSDGLSGIFHSPGSSDSSAAESGSPAATDGASVHPGASSGSPSSSRGASAPTGSGTASPSSGGRHSADPSPAASAGDEQDNSALVGGSSALVDTGAIGGGRHRGGSADENDGTDGAGGAGRGSDAPGRHASRGDADARTAPAGAYTVRTGDSLASIADSLGVDGGWRALYAANEKAVGADPDHISAGQTLDVPSEKAPK